MIAHALAELPNECVGLLAGHLVGQEGLAVERFPLVNELADPRRFRSEPHGLFQAHRHCRENGLEFLASYHSHPTSAAVPSRTDMELQEWDTLISIIISCVPPVSVRAYWVSKESYREADWQIVDEA
jgi:proteasome lid subunit RPN8/RPN11